MAKYRRYRKYSRRSRGRWSANIQELGTTNISVPAEAGAWSQTYTLAFNPTQVNTAVSQIYTVKNFEVTFEITSDRSSSGVNLNYIEDIAAYIMFVPQGMNVTSSYNTQHPEYIMAYKFIGTPTEDSNLTSKAQAPRVKTRLSRKLNTGDSVILFIKGNHTATTENPQAIEFHGLARWWTKAN